MKSQHASISDFPLAVLWTDQTHLRLHGYIN
jgi:hypothetical protein